MKRLVTIFVVVLSLLSIGYKVVSYVKNRQASIEAHAAVNDFYTMMENLAKNSATCAEIAKAMQDLDRPEALAEWKIHFKKLESMNIGERDTELLLKRIIQSEKRLVEEITTKCESEQEMFLDIMLRFARIGKHVTGQADVREIGVASDFFIMLADLTKDDATCIEIAKAVNALDNPKILSDWKTRLSKEEKARKAMQKDHIKLATGGELDKVATQEDLDDIKNFDANLSLIDRQRSINAFLGLFGSLTGCRGTSEKTEIDTGLLKIVAHVFDVEVDKIDMTGVSPLSDFSMMLPDLVTDESTCTEIAKTMRDLKNDMDKPGTEWRTRFEKRKKTEDTYPIGVLYLISQSEMNRAYDGGMLFGEKLGTKCGDTPEFDEILKDFTEMASMIDAL